MDTKTLIEKVCATSALNTTQGRAVIDAFAELLYSCGMEADSVAVPGFGTFETKKRLERINVHPSTGKRVLLPPKIVLGFKPSALLKQKINKQ